MKTRPEKRSTPKASTQKAVQTQRVFRLLGRFIASLSESEIEAISNGTASLTISKDTSAKQTGEQSSSNHNDSRNFDADQIKQQLSAFRSSESALKFLANEQLSRNQLEQVLRLVDLPLSHQDTSSRLEQKVVEALVGSRLNSQAVRGELDLEGSQEGQLSSPERKPV